MGIVYAVIGAFLVLYIFTGLVYLLTFLAHFVMALRAKETFSAALKKAHRTVLKQAKAYPCDPLFVFGLVGFIAKLPCNFLFAYKSLITFVNPYKWDPKFAEWDRLVHLGWYPHELLSFLLDIPYVALFFDISYGVWFQVSILACYFALFFDRNFARRMKFIHGFILSWIIGGSFLAMYFSSVGPIFFHEFYKDAPDVYAGLREHLDSINEASRLPTYSMRHVVVEWTTNDKHIDPNSLSAMPSMHMWLMWLVVLYCREINKYVFAGALFFSLLTYVAVVSFGIHYAIDCYVSIALMSLLWWALGRKFRPVSA